MRGANITGIKETTRTIQAPFKASILFGMKNIAEENLMNTDDSVGTLRGYIEKSRRQGTMHAFFVFIDHCFVAFIHIRN